MRGANQTGSDIVVPTGLGVRIILWSNLVGMGLGHVRDIPNDIVLRLD